VAGSIRVLRGGAQMDADARRYVDRRIRLLTKRLDKQADAIQQIADYLTAHANRHITLDLGNAASGATVVPITFAAVTSTYSVQATLIVAAANVGQIFASLQSGSATATGANILVVNRTANPIAAGLDVLIVPD
jgi:hypothetical protein